MSLVVLGLFAITGLTSSAYAGNIIATGHDMDFHCDVEGSPEECEYLKIIVGKVRNGSTLPMLVLDQGTELPTALAAAGFGAGEMVTVNPANTGEFDAKPFVDSSAHPIYSAIIVASDETCGGCDNNEEGEANINARASDFEKYFNGGGGILALAGAARFETFYNFVPLKVGATLVSAPFTVTPEGAALGITEAMANCCATHNSFSIPPSPLVVLEDDSAGKAETIAAFDATIERERFESTAEKERAEQERREREAQTVVRVTPPTSTTGGGGALPFKLTSPVLGKTVNVKPVSGVVLVKLPPGAHLSTAGPLASAFESLSKGTGFIPLTEARQIPVGSTLDTTHGLVQLTTATASTNRFQEGDFGAGIFTILQKREQRGLTDLNIVNTRPRKVCTTLGKKASVARKHLSSKVLGRLNGSAHGKYTTHGQDSAATVRGTIWGVTNRCDGTLTQVKRGVVSVRDLVRRKTITLHAGQQYLAKAP